ncbi:hypothetical protein Q0F99_00215 [Rathayibacter oskolensis]|uniref:hypothetical protein n=1 Tax=Rathayibacter oskolensis TaxID=1891671 RepID=UPI00265D69A9|nr:hypothetical protein [Rathayibacter oskolensis]WKK71695.1 hypothetical protein Q0F99_00215 [Rathayibacter oskolensis]
MDAEPRTRLPFGLGVVDAKTADELAAEIVDGVHRGRIIGNLNLHGLYLYRTDEQFKRYCDEADTVVIDGWPVLALARGSDDRR